MRGIDFVFPSVTDDIIITWQLASAPTVEVGREVFPPSTDMRTCVPLNLKRKAYIFRFYSSSDGVTLETQLRPDWAVDGEMFGNITETYHYVVNGSGPYDPAPAPNRSLRDPRLFNKDFDVESRGTGTRRPDEYEVVNDDPDGGFDLIVEDDDGNVEQFNDGDTWTVFVKGEQTTSGGGDTTAPDINEITEDTDFDETFLGKVNIARGSGAILEVTFPSFAGIADGVARFTTFTGTQRYLRLDFGDDTLFFEGDDRNFIDLASGEMIEILFKEGVGYVIDSKTNYRKAGETIMVNKKDMIGTLLCDGSGVEYNISDFQRVIDNLPEEMKVSYADWNLTQNVTVGNVTKSYYKNRGKFAIDSINGKFKFPDGRGWSFRALNNFDGTTDSTRLSQGSGGAQAQNLISHKHAFKTAQNDNNGVSVKGRFGDNGFDGETKLTGGTEQAVDNLGKYIVVIL